MFWQNWLRSYVENDANRSNPLYVEARQLFVSYEFLVSMLLQEPAPPVGVLMSSASMTASHGPVPRRGAPRVAALRSGESESGVKRGRESTSGLVLSPQRVSSSSRL